MKRLVLFSFLLLITTVLAGADAERQRIRLRILRDKTPMAGITVKVTFPEEGRSIGTTLTLVTNSAGFVETEIPSTVFWVTVPEENPDVVGKKFHFARKETSTKQWDLRPREWKNETRENRR